MIDEVELLRQHRPAVGPPSPEARRAAERQLRALILAPGVGGRKRPRFRIAARLAPVLALLVTAAVVLVFLGGHKDRSSGSAVLSGPKLVFAARPAGPAGEVKVGVVARAAAILQRLISGLPGQQGQAAVTRAGTSVVVQLGRGGRLSGPELLSLVDATGRLVFYDWEADSLTANGQTVAAGLARRNQSALLISQGGALSGPGAPGAGSLALYIAVRLASRQPALVSSDNGRPGPEYFAFGAPGSHACAVAARYYNTPEVRGARCYLAGPTSIEGTIALLPPGVSRDKVETLMVPEGTVVLQAVPASFDRRPSVSDPSARFYVLRDQAALFGSAIIKPQRTIDQSGSTAIAIGFTAKGAAAFQRMTAQVVHRGELLSGIGQTLNQHFAAALGDQLLTVPSVDFRSYPDGVPGNNGADITGGYTSRSAHRVSEEMQLGALPITLQLVSSSTGG